MQKSLLQYHLALDLFNTSFASMLALSSRVIQHQSLPLPHKVKLKQMHFVKMKKNNSQYVAVENIWFSFYADSTLLDSLLPADSMWYRASCLTWDQVMAWCPHAPNQYMNQCQFIIHGVLRHSAEGNFTGNDKYIVWQIVSENLTYNIATPSPRSLCVK